MPEPSDKAFERILDGLRSGNDSGYPVLYPPMPLWPAWTRDEAAVRSWRQTLSTRLPTELIVRVPYCKTICTFCFLPVVGDGAGSKRDGFLTALELEARLYAPIFKRTRFSSIYIGGGTPNLLDEAQIDRLFATLRRHFRFSSRAQIAMDANPDFLDRDKARALKANGVNWLAMGIQSLDDRVTRRIRRTQDNSRVFQAYANAREAGIGINVDLICGLPEQTPESFLSDVKTIAAWRPDEIHLFLFKALANTPFAKVGGSITGEQLKGWRRLQKEGMELLLAAGYRAIDEESAALSRGAQNRQSRLLYCDLFSVLGLGMGSVSLAHGRARYVNTMDQAVYERSLREGKLPIARGIVLRPRDEMINYLLLQFAEKRRVRNARFRRLFATSLSNEFSSPLSDLLSRGILRKVGGSLQVESPRADFEIPKALFEPPVLSALLDRFPL